VIVIYFVQIKNEKKKETKNENRVAIQFKMEFLEELGFDI
jgi:hypothetical protein